MTALLDGAEGGWAGARKSCPHRLGSAGNVTRRHRDTSSFPEKFLSILDSPLLVLRSSLRRDICFVGWVVPGKPGSVGSNPVRDPPVTECTLGGTGMVGGRFGFRPSCLEGPAKID